MSDPDIGDLSARLDDLERVLTVIERIGLAITDLQVRVDWLDAHVHESVDNPYADRRMTGLPVDGGDE